MVPLAISSKDATFFNFSGFTPQGGPKTALWHEHATNGNTDWFPCFIYSTLKSLRHSTFLRFWLKNYLLFFAVFLDTKNAPQILFFTNFFHIMPKLINFNHNYIKLNNCCYNFYKMFIMLNMAFKCDQKSSCDVWWQSFDLHMGFRALAVLKGPMVLLQIYEIY